MFISELTWELMSVALVFTTDVFNELVILSLWVDIESCENEIQNSKNKRAVKKILLFCFCFSTHRSSSFFLLQLLQLIKMLFFFFFYLMNNVQSYASAETWFTVEIDVISRTSVYIASNSFFDSHFRCLFLASLEIRRTLLLIRASLLSVNHSRKSVSLFFAVASSLKEKQFSSAEDTHLF